MNYTPIHLHTAEGSIRDSIIITDELIKKAKELNIKSLAITDHGSLSNMYNFYYKCIENNIKPIIGCEVYFVPFRYEFNNIKDKSNYHLILLAKNNIGFKNLLKIVSDASINGTYYKPRTDWETLSKHHEGLICTSACVGGYIPQLILNNNEYVDLVIKDFKELFKDDFYLEIQPGSFTEQTIVNTTLIELSQKYNIKLVASNDIHYLNKEDYLAHDLHIRDGRNNEISDELIYPDINYYLMSYKELLDSFIEINVDKQIALKAINNTNIIDVSCETLSIGQTELNLPSFKCPSNYTPYNYLEHICFEKLNQISYKIQNPNKYITRLYYELDVINQLGFVSYFLIIRDIIMYCKNNNIKVGPGRGSVVGSLVAYLSDITQVDPIKYNLLFERFLSVHRKNSIPDVDLDISSEYRDKVFEYVINKYGYDKCCAVSTLGIRKAKSAIKSAGRILGIEPEIQNTITKLIPDHQYVDLEEGVDKKIDLSIEESLETVSELREYQTIYPELFDIAKRIEGLPDKSGIHAAGTIIAKDNLINTIPLIKNKNDIIHATSLNLQDAEKQMLIKYDLLSLSNLHIIQMLEKATGFILNIEENDFDDKDTWDIIGSKYTTGLFQISSDTYKQRMGRLKPKTIEELADCLALIRGPCISSNLDKKYMNIVEGKDTINNIHPVYDDATKNTNGILIYQEQLMQCCNNMGLPLHESYDVMKAVSKKKTDKIKSYKDKLLLLTKDIMDTNTFNTIFKIMTDAGKYLFNKSHACAYATISYVTAYYKVHYPLEFFTCLLTTTYINKTDAKKKKEKLEEIMNDCIRLGIKFLPLDMNKSDWNFTIEDNKIRIGFCALPSFSYNTYKHVKETCIPFNNESTYVSQILSKVTPSICNKQAISTLICSTALGDRIDTYEELCEIKKVKDMDYIVKVSNTEIELFAPLEEIEYLLYKTNFIYNRTNNLSKIGIDDIKNNQEFIINGYVKSISKKKDKNNNTMAFIKLETGDGVLDAVLFSSIYYKYNKIIKKNSFITVKAIMQKNNKYNSCKIIEATSM